MRLARVGAAAVLVFGLGAANAVEAAFDAYLNFGDIKGESTDKDHKDWIVVESFSFGVTRQGSVAVASRTARRPELQSLTISKRLDSSTPLLQAACATGRHFNEVTLEKGYIKYELHDVIISSVKEGPTETLTLNYASVTEVRMPPPSARAGAVAPNRMLVHHP